jgi:hypothetical protein
MLPEIKAKRTGNYKCLQPEQKERIIALYNEGYSVGNIESITKHGRDTIKRILSAANITPENRGHNIPKEVVKRFKINKKTGCWDWTGSTKVSSSYGTFYMKNQEHLAHRFFYQYYKGDVGDARVMHKCRNPGCVNPDHLYLKDTLDLLRKVKRIAKKYKVS